VTERRRYAALRGKITPRTRNRFGSADFDGTVGRTVHGSAEEATDLAELDPASQPAGEHELAAEVSERIRAIISSAEAAAGAVRHEAEQRAQVKRRLADDEAHRIVEDARRDAEAFLAERIRRISELSDDVVERGEGIVMRLDRAEEVRRQLQGLADALGESAEELARELGGEPGTPRAERRTAPEATKPPPLRPPTEPPLERKPAAEPAPVEEIAEDPTVGELAGDAAVAEAKAEAQAEAAEAEEEIPVVPVELVPDEPQDAPEPEPARSREPDEQLSARLVALQMAVAGGKRAEVEAHLQRTFNLGDVTQILDDVFGDDDGDEKAGWPTTRGGAA
jgi:hypothetical protein